MKSILHLVLFVTLFFGSCKKDPIADLQGTYKGTCHTINSGLDLSTGVFYEQKDSTAAEITLTHIDGNKFSVIGGGACYHGLATSIEFDVNGDTLKYFESPSLKFSSTLIVLIKERKIISRYRRTNTYYPGGEENEGIFEK